MQYTIEETLQDELDMSSMLPLNLSRCYLHYLKFSKRLFMKKRSKDHDFFFWRLSATGGGKNQLLSADSSCWIGRACLLGDKAAISAFVAIGSRRPQFIYARYGNAV